MGRVCGGYTGLAEGAWDASLEDICSKGTYIDCIENNEMRNPNTISQ